MINEKNIENEFLDEKWYSSNQESNNDLRDQTENGI